VSICAKVLVNTTIDVQNTSKILIITFKFESIKLQIY